MKVFITLGPEPHRPLPDMYNNLTQLPEKNIFVKHHSNNYGQGPVCGRFLVVLVLLFAHPALGTLKGQARSSMALALVQKPEGFSGWWGNVAQEAPGGWALCLEAEFPASLPILRSSRTRLPSSACSWTGPPGRWGSGFVSLRPTCWNTSAAPSRVAVADRPAMMQAEFRQVRKESGGGRWQWCR